MTEVEPTGESVPTGDGLVALSRQHQLLALPMFVLTSVPTDAGIAAVMEAIPAHGDYWAKLEEEGVLFAGGPVLSGHGSDPWSGRAMFIFQAQSLDAARAVAEADPMHTGGARQYELRPWLLNHLVVPDGVKP
ncbi:hypothetical protein C4J65_34845 [Streptomyces sp. CB09001]|uniref:YciI family protein n=1 Tax=Streptomyces sp. CB09001 TaxID=2083284 RepID=UPI000E2118FF|nr:YciI family protein [Streptomyces sp. CB09001]AXL92883.1 hypothetical protein C4J65_34845 [Streptomyces sp. CB09001]